MIFETKDLLEINGSMVLFFRSMIVSKFELYSSLLVVTHSENSFP